MKRLLGQLLVVVTLPLGSLLAADGAIPIWEPISITEPGKYILTRNIYGTILIRADGVDLDLNGFTIDTGTSGAGALDVLNVSDISIHDGRLVTSFDGTIGLQNVTQFSIRRTVNESVDDCGLVVFEGSNGIIEDNQFDKSQDGLCIRGTGITIRLNSINGTAGAGIHVSGDGCVIAENTLDQGRITVDSQDSQNNLILRNTVSNGAGIRIEGSRNHIEGNLLSGGTFGLSFAFGSTDNTYRGNIARGNSFFDFSDEGTNNTSHGDNYMPGQM